MNKLIDLTPVLMLVPYFAPQTHAAMFRAHKLAKYLPEHGFRPIVVTTDINYLYNEDAALLGELPSCVEVHRARFVEPTLRGLRMAMGGSDRTFAGMKRQGILSAMKATQNSNGAQDASGGISRADVIRVLGEWPDRHWIWARTARVLCRRLIQEHGIRLLYTSAVPTSPLSTAAALQREFVGLRWVADYRDPVGYGHKHTAQGPVSGAQEQRIIRHAMERADMITGLAGSYQSIFFDLYAVPESRYRFIPTGLDEAYLDDAPAEQRRVFVHIGEVMPNQSRHALAVIASAARIRPDVFSGYRLEVVGRSEINQPLIEAMLSDIPGWTLPVDFIDHVHQAEVYQRVRTARAALLIPGRGRYWWTNFAKMADYIALGVPVIADVPPISEAREELTKAGNACFLQGDSADTDAEMLLDWLAGAPKAQMKTGYARRYTAARQAGEFADVFRQLRDA